MKHIQFKAREKYSLKRYRDPKFPLVDRIFPSRHFAQNFATEQAPGKGLTKQALAALPAGIHVIHRNPEAKLVKHLIQRAFGKVITSCKPVNQRTTWSKQHKK